jgi:hypothetical protein
MKGIRMITIERTERGSWENTIDSTNAKTVMLDAFNGTINGEWVWTDPIKTGIQPQYATAPATRVHHFVKTQILDLIGFLDDTGGAYISNDGIDEYCNEIEAVYDVEFRNDLYAYDPQYDTPVDEREYATQRDIAEVNLKHLLPYEIEILKTLAELRPAYCDSMFRDEPLPKYYDGIDTLIHIFNAVLELIPDA